MIDTKQRGNDGVIVRRRLHPDPEKTQYSESENAEEVKTEKEKKDD